MIAVDSSVVIAAFASWHEHHAIAQETMRSTPALPSHAALEAYSVLTRLPDPFRAEAGVVADYLLRQFGKKRLVLPAGAHGSLPATLAALGLAGGAVCDALIGLTARHAGAEIHSLDRRAKGTYDRCEVPARLLIN